MILSFKNKETEKIWNRKYSKKYPNNIQRNTYKKLVLLHSAVSIDDLIVPQGNRLHKLSGDRKGQYSISINAQWRICFIWENGNVKNAEITDYH